MKSNDKLGFSLVHRDSVVTYDDCHTIGANIGVKGEKYRVYGYVFYHDRDAAREGMRGDCCGYGDSTDEAIEQFGANAKALQWDANRVDALCSTLRMELEDLGD